VELSGNARTVLEKEKLVLRQNLVLTKQIVK
jgi:hypothetical protein